MILGRRMFETCDLEPRRTLAGRKVVIGSDEVECTIVTTRLLTKNAGRGGGG